MKSLSRVRPCANPWTIAHQAPPSMGFSRQEYWSGVPLPSLHLLYTQQQNHTAREKAYWDKRNLWPLNCRSLLKRMFVLFYPALLDVLQEDFSSYQFTVLPKSEPLRKLETRKQMIETSEKNILFIQRMTSSVVQNAV